MNTLNDFIYPEKDANRYSLIRFRARQITKKRERKCQYCGYNKHVETCHIKGINEFGLNASLELINAEDNLILLCPNCHWEKDNLQKKIELEKRKICACGNKKWYNAVSCYKCNNKKMAFNKRKVKNRPEKEELTKLVNSIPMTHIAQIYNVSQNTIKKWCNSCGIELGNRAGYWQKVKSKRNGGPTDLGTSRKDAL